MHVLNGKIIDIRTIEGEYGLAIVVKLLSSDNNIFQTFLPKEMPVENDEVLDFKHNMKYCTTLPLRIEHTP